MLRTTRVVFGLLATTLVAAGILAGCGGQNSSDEPVVTPPEMPKAGTPYSPPQGKLPPAAANAAGGKTSG